MTLLKNMAVVIMSILLLFLVGCGGGSSDASGTLALTVATTSITAGDTGTATATYSAVGGKNPQGLLVGFSTEPSGIIALDSQEKSVGSDGTAVITFRALTVPADTAIKIIAHTGGLSQFQTVTVKAPPASGGGGVVTPPPVVTATPNSIAFNKALPANISLKGMGGAGLVETSIVSFIVKDTADKPLAGQTVDFSLNTTVGGLAITPSSSVSDASGIVQTIVSAGIIATPVRVTATVRGTTITVQSDQLVVSTGIPAQDGFSISVSNLNSESYDHDGVSVDVTARLSDHFHNPVPDGTAVYFTTSGAAIQSSCTTVGGACTVKWISQNPRPQSPIGRPAILAYAVGEESFVDSNGNGLADTGEFVDTSEAFRDDNFNGVKDASETYIDFNGDGIFNGPDGSYNGVLRPATIPATVSKTKHIFSNTQIVMSTDEAIITANPPGGLAGSGQIDIIVTDLNGNTMASGTTITTKVPFGQVSGATSFTVPQNIGHGVALPVFVSPAATPKFQSGLIEIAVKSPGGLTTNAWIPISGNF